MLYILLGIKVFSTKDMIPEDLNSNVVYKFNCARCNSCYIAETTRHISTRINEHLKTDKASHVYKHLNSNLECKKVCNVTCFSILDTAPTTYQLRIKEGLYIGLEEPSLNKQVKHLSSTLSL